MRDAVSVQLPARKLLMQKSKESWSDDGDGVELTRGRMENLWKRSPDGGGEKKQMTGGAGRKEDADAAAQYWQRVGVAALLRHSELPEELEEGRGGADDPSMCLNQHKAAPVKGGVHEGPKMSPQAPVTKIEIPHGQGRSFPHVHLHLAQKASHLQRRKLTPAPQQGEQASQHQPPLSGAVPEHGNPTRHLLEILEAHVGKWALLGGIFVSAPPQQTWKHCQKWSRSRLHPGVIHLGFVMSFLLN
ncbi:hypothetical protein CCM_09307 [Cordyceps militaris CM01]|uniref:Uncharacterized protein n=1 Tax=Cordyceps militaris (strain CM01) TaxID=983644 RepID=G3JU17_CORMM|nr:uncharacterized protein CCM_09307 [Cordyceps militaris CM01]EGX88171.1 hypothetical protein CCM_09307 [Cordyceps militaris CM01]